MINIIVPVFAILLCGFFAGRFDLLSGNAVKSLNYYVYYFALPALLFSSLSQAQIKELTNWPFISTIFTSVLISFWIVILIARFLCKKRLSEAAIYGMASVYGNTGFLGIPLIMAIFGKDAAIPAAIATFVYDLSLITLVILLIEISKMSHDQQGTFMVLLKKVIQTVMLNPINASLLLGMMVAFLPIPIPTPIIVFAEILGSAAGPTALFALGLGLAANLFTFRLSRKLQSDIWVIIAFKLFLLPLVTIILVKHVLTLEPKLASIAIILSVLPVGAVVNVFAEKYELMAKQIPIVIVLSTFISIPILSIILIIFE